MWAVWTLSASPASGRPRRSLACERSIKTPLVICPHSVGPGCGGVWQEGPPLPDCTSVAGLPRAGGWGVWPSAGPGALTLHTLGPDLEPAQHILTYDLHGRPAGSQD